MIILSRHARRQMKWRGISLQDIELVVNKPFKETPSVKGRVNIWGETAKGLLKITIAKEGDNIIVVTVIRRERK